MPKFVFFNYGNGYEKCILNAVEGERNVLFYKKFSLKIIQKIFEIHNSWTLNRKYELPFKNIWFKHCLQDVPNNEEVYFIFYEAFHLSYSKKFLNYIKLNYKDAKLCFMFSNPVDEYNLHKLSVVKTYYDGIITFCKDDAERYGFLFLENWLFKVPLMLDKIEPQYDVFFVGANKGRLKQLLEIYEQLVAANLKCDFHITGVEEDQQKYANDIVYNIKMSYDEVLYRVQNSRCVLEVLQGSNCYMSIRTLEAMQYHKKLLTTNQAVHNHSMYDSNIIQIIDEEKKFDIDFLKENVDEKVYPDINLWTYKAFEKFILDNI